MPICELKLIRRSAAATADAWFVPGESPAEWFATVLRDQPISANARFLVVISAAMSSRPGDSEVVPDEGKDAPVGVIVYGLSGDLEAGPVWPLRFVGDHLLVPADATICPALESEEVDHLIQNSGHSLCVWFPHRRPLYYDNGDILSGADLIADRSGANRTWNKGLPATKLNPRLLSVGLRHIPDASDIMKSAGDGIGQRSRELFGKGKSSPSEEPGSPGETNVSGPPEGQPGRDSAVGRLLGSITGGFGALGSFVKGLARGIPEGGHAGKRQQQVNKLLEMLQTNPDLGLRFALPFGGERGRGEGGGGNKLAEAEPTYGGGRFADGPSSYWDLNHDTQLRLRRRYQELARREISLGRHRRAAYIYADLLGDYSSAARVLSDGGDFREAAVLYQEKLRDPKAAAECLHKGGLLREALEIYQDLARHDAAAKILQELGEDDEAAGAWQRHVDQLLAERKIIAASHVLQNQLNEVPRALKVLQDAWSVRTTEAGYPRAMLELCAAQGLTSEADATVLDVRELAGRLQSLDTRFVRLLQETVDSYPNTAVRRSAERCCRELIADGLCQRSSERVPELLRLLRKLAPDDALLAADTHRFFYSQPPARVSTRISAGELIQQLPHEMRCFSVCETRDELFILGERDQRLSAAGIELAQPDQSAETAEFPFSATEDSLVAAASRYSDPRLMLAQGRSESVLNFRGGRGGLVEKIGPFPGHVKHILAATAAASGGIWILDREWTVRRFGTTGTMQNIWLDVPIRESGGPVPALPFEPSDPHLVSTEDSGDIDRIRLVAERAMLCWTYGAQLSILNAPSLSSDDQHARYDTVLFETDRHQDLTERIQRFSFASPVRRLVLWADESQPQIVVGLDYEIVIHNPATNDQQSLGYGLQSPVPGKLPSGEIIVAGACGQIELYRKQDGRFRLLQGTRRSPGKILAVCPVGRRQVLLVDAGGGIERRTIGE